MNRERFLHHCQDSDAGMDSFVRHPATDEEGRVMECHFESGHFVVKTAENLNRCWNFSECEDLDHPKSGPMI